MTRIFASLFVVVLSASAAAAGPMAPFAGQVIGHQSGCFLTGNGEECCHAGPVVYHCH